MNPEKSAMFPRAVIFDCDGTLVDSETSGITAMHEEACKLGYAMPLDYALLEFRGKRMAACFALIEDGLGHAVPQDFETTVRQAMAIKFKVTVTAMPGAVPLLQGLRQAAIPYCIASNGPQEKMVLTLGIAGLTDYFSQHVFSAYEIGHWKPDPELFLHAAREMVVAPGDCVVVEDSLSGIAAGLAAGMRVYSMCEPSSISADIASRIVQIEGLNSLPAMWGLAQNEATAAA
ncbi:MAG: HAD family hydrolase [Polaromonas sp.]